MKKGMVTLVGAGPGDSGLMTLKGAQKLSKADTVVFDRLVSAEILAMIPAGVEKIDVGKSGGNHPVPQDKINEILLQKALEGKNVVRLKGGDPFVFGRGGEELELLEQSGVDFEVVPGVTSAVAVSAYAGIPLTHRDYCSSFHVITGHAREGGSLEIPFESLVKFGGTLVFLMGVSSLAFISKGLIEAGMDREMPAAVIERGTTPKQRKFVSTLSELPAVVNKNEVKSPAVIVVGRVCLLSEKFDWFMKKPLFGCGVAVTRHESSFGVLSEKLRTLGARVYDYPCMETVEIEENPALDNAIDRLSDYRYLVFTSKIGVDIFFNRLKKRRLDFRTLASLKIAVVGSRTAAAIEAYGLIADYVPPVFDSVHLAEGLAELADPNEKLLICRAAKGTPDLIEILERYGVEYEDVPLYQTIYKKEKCSEFEKLLLEGKVDFVTFTSKSTVEGFVNSVDIDFSTVKGVCIGRQTATEAEKYGIKCMVSDVATLDSVADKIVEVRSNGTC